MRAISATDLPSLIGSCDLELNRLMSLLMDEYEQSQDSSLVQSLGVLNTGGLSALLGVRIQSNQSLRLSSECIKQGLVTLDDLWPYLSPSSLSNFKNDYFAKANDIKMTSDTVSLTAAANSTDIEQLRDCQDSSKMTLLGWLILQNLSLIHI